MPRGQGIYLRITKKVLADLFDLSQHTINKMIWNKELDPTDLSSVIELYLKRKNKKEDKLNKIKQLVCELEVELKDKM